jgi:hypothetical protein
MAVVKGSDPYCEAMQLIVSRFGRAAWLSHPVRQALIEVMGFTERKRRRFK